MNIMIDSLNRRWPDENGLAVATIRNQRPNARRTNPKHLSNQRLREENLAFTGTDGVSKNNRSRGFAPAFHDARTGRVEIARYTDGSPAPMHLLDGVPEEWVAERDSSGRVIALKDTVISGFLYQGRFYTRALAAALSSS